jgi:hypothetical protein
MHSEAQAIARLKSMVFLIEEALRIADEGTILWSAQSLATA